MEDLIQVIFLVIFGLVAVLGRILSQRRQSQAPDGGLDEEEVTLPPWGNVPEPQEASPPPSVERKTPPTRPSATPTIESTRPSPPPERAQPAREAMHQPAHMEHMEPHTPGRSTIAGLPVCPRTFRQAIILTEILQRPKSLRQPPQ